MATFYLTFLVLGTTVLVVQFGLGLLGVDGEGVFDADVDPGAADGLDLFTVRALSAAAAFFGVVGVGMMRLGLGGWLALPFALVAAVAAAVGVASTMRAMKRLEQDKSFRLESTLGLTATVSLSIPAAGAGTGKVHLVAHERFQEFDAVTREEALPAGASVHVVDVVSPDTLVVARATPLLEESNDPR